MFVFYTNQTPEERVIEVVFGHHGCTLCNCTRWFDRGSTYRENLPFSCANSPRLYIKTLPSIRKCTENSERFFLKRKKNRSPLSGRRTPRCSAWNGAGLAWYLRNYLYGASLYVTPTPSLYFVGVLLFLRCDKGVCCTWKLRGESMVLKECKRFRK